MSLIIKPWARFLVSIFGGGFVAELLHILSGDPNRPRTSNLTLLYTIAIYLLLSVWARHQVRNSR